ncbi:hypothetical protein GCM10010289_61790 [Streptomyces violascens]|uniref:Uncharacterized protein n=1 Tax=Streptomyces violascens TaxID=67381 RepID=A0ABQ3R250_9ACTN|nr:hypothetical protein GCM10010289_61790 [Streptomyces violascens]GHI43603.1 hypothetical protein Sviol_80110 [Streptomyces violascens]
MLADLDVPDAALGYEAADEALADTEAVGRFRDGKEAVSHAGSPPSRRAGDGGGAGGQGALRFGARRFLVWHGGAIPRVCRW